MIKPTVFAALLLLSACAGDFSLGTVHPYPGATAARQAWDIEACRDWAWSASGTEDRRFNALLLELSVIGIPIAYEADKSMQRRAFAWCMAARGYTVTAAQD